MKWLNFLENAFGTKDKKRKRAKDGQLKPGKFEKAVLENEEMRYKPKGFQTFKNPTNYLHHRVEGTLRNDKRKSVKDRNLFRDRETPAFERLLRLKYLSKDKQTRDKQLESLRGWIDYLRKVYISESKYGYEASGIFKYFVLRSILKYNQNWEVRSKDSTEVFPSFDPEMSPKILERMLEQLTEEFFNETKTSADKFMESIMPAKPSAKEIKKAIETADFRELYGVIRKELAKTWIKQENVESKSEGEWLPVFTYKNAKGDAEKEKIVRALDKVIKNSRGASKIDKLSAERLLRRPDDPIAGPNRNVREEVHVYSIKNRIKGKKDEVDVPEILISYVEDPYYSNIYVYLVHDDSKDLELRKKYLEIARKYISESDFKSKNEFEQRFRNEIKYQELYEKICPNGKAIEGIRETLTKEDVAFLFGVGTEIEMFETPTYKLDELRKLYIADVEKYLIGDELPFKQSDYDHVKGMTLMTLKYIYAKLYDVKPDEVWGGGIIWKDEGFDRSILKNIKVYVGHALDLHDIEGNLDFFENLEVVIGFLHLRSTDDLLTLKNLKVVGNSIGFYSIGDLSKFKGRTIKTRDQVLHLDNVKEMGRRKFLN